MAIPVRDGMAGTVTRGPGAVCGLTSPCRGSAIFAHIASAGKRAINRGMDFNPEAETKLRLKAVRLNAVERS
jgi:hypothetical protein